MSEHEPNHCFARVEAEIRLADEPRRASRVAHPGVRRAGDCNELHLGAVRARTPCRDLQIGVGQVDGHDRCTGASDCGGVSARRDPRRPEVDAGDAGGTAATIDRVVRVGRS
ncbi:MAG: hypothetical protein WCI22_17170, partial [Actinomycetota bacterium]